MVGRLAERVPSHRSVSMEDDYPTCRETYVTLRVYHKTAEPAEVTRALGLEPSDAQMVGEVFEARNKKRTYEISGWFFCSKDAVESYDSEKHLDWLLSQIESKKNALAALKQQGWWMDISCYWDSDQGDGGPTLSPALLKRLAAAETTLWFDVYFYGAYIRAQRGKKIRGFTGEV